ncbi:MAG: 50S ribosomal protein L25 [Patescibacteria group bacterium]|nr:50S ribosomal protein L25 [Patescibacteria group bacterium]
MEALKLEAQKREVTGKQVKQLREQGLVPAVIYGHGEANRDVAVSEGVFIKLLDQAGESTLIDLSVDGGAPVKVLIQDVQRDALTGRIIHADFRQVKMTEKLEAHVEFNYLGEAPAVKELGAILVKSMESIMVRCLPQNLVHEIDVDLTSLKNIDDLVTVADLPKHEGVEYLARPEDVVVVINAPISEAELKEMEAKPELDVAAVKVEGEEKKAEKAAEAGEKKEEKKK